MKVPPCKPDARLTLVSHVLCPYVQRAAITLAEKRVSFARRDVDLSNKPAWFLDVSPLGKTPVLLVDDVPVFESAVICEYLDETTAPRLHPDDALERARHRGWIEVASAILNTIAGFYNAVDADALESRRGNLVQHFARVEAALRGGEGNSYFPARTFPWWTPRSRPHSAISTPSTRSRTLASSKRRRRFARGGPRLPRAHRYEARLPSTIPCACVAFSKNAIASFHAS